ncbi:MAG: hypothetical protein LWY06_11650 [Firmicutes bacterium]|nr:hypothetical protein [Bacillota bacterium]
MKKIGFAVVMALLVFSLLTTSVFAAAAGATQNGNKPTRTIENVSLTTQAVRQEFVWDDASGTFQTVNLYTIGEVKDYLADMNVVLNKGAAGNGTIIGSPSDYTYWDGTKWVTLDNVTRYVGTDQRAEAVVSRYDKTYYTMSTSYWSSVTGYQTLYSTYYSYYSYYVEDHMVVQTFTNVVSTGQVAKTGTFSKATEVPAAFEPIVQVNLANGWSVQITSHYNIWGNQVRITSPTGTSSYIYGDPHLLQAGGSQQQELAAVGDYVFDLGGYTLDLACMQSNNGFSLITDLSITGPNNYTMTYGRNNEVKVSGGTP